MSSLSQPAQDYKESLAKNSCKGKPKFYPAILLHGESLLIFNILIVSSIFVQERKFDGISNVYLSKFIVLL